MLNWRQEFFNSKEMEKSPTIIADFLSSFQDVYILGEVLMSPFNGGILLVFEIYENYVMDVNYNSVATSAEPELN